MNHTLRRNEWLPRCMHANTMYCSTLLEPFGRHLHCFMRSNTQQWSHLSAPTTMFSTILHNVLCVLCMYDTTMARGFPLLRVAPTSMPHNALPRTIQFMWLDACLWPIPRCCSNYPGHHPSTCIVWCFVYWPLCFAAITWSPPLCAMANSRLTDMHDCISLSVIHAMPWCLAQSVHQH